MLTNWKVIADCTAPEYPSGNHALVLSKNTVISAELGETGTILTVAYAGGKNRIFNVTGLVYLDLYKVKEKCTVPQYPNGSHVYLLNAGQQIWAKLLSTGRIVAWMEYAQNQRSYFDVTGHVVIMNVAKTEVQIM